MNRDSRLRVMEGSWPTLSEQDELFNNLRDQWERPSRASQRIPIPLQHRSHESKDECFASVTITTLIADVRANTGTIQSDVDKINGKLDSLAAPVLTVWTIVDEAVSDPDPDRRIERLIGLLKSGTAATKSAAHIALYMELGPAEMTAVLSREHRGPLNLFPPADGEK